MNYKQLTQEQRYQIYEMKHMQLRQKDIARILAVSESTISRELKRNCGSRGHYLK
ncbi:MAG: IS30 family transposase, partial [Cocleimonas sp.]